MFRHTVEYVDFNGNDRKEELLFHLNLPEVARLEIELGRGLKEYIEELTNNQKVGDLLQFLEKLILSSYGVRTSDGRTFHKSKELRSDFENSHAYAEFFEQLLTVPGLASKFGEQVADNGKVRKNQVTPQVVDTPKQ